MASSAVQDRGLQEKRSRVGSVAFARGELEVAKAAALAAGMSFNGWMRRAAMEQAAFEAALRVAEGQGEGSDG